MSLNEELKSRWFKIDAGLAKLSELRNTLFADMPDIADPTEEVNKLKNGLYTIAVCGPVKAGKSTLLNSLFFGDTVLPEDATPTTAKLTFICYGEGLPKFDVEFYSKDEWDHRRELYNEKQRKELSERLEKCAERGVHVNNWICSPRHVNESYCGEDLKGELLKYIADPLKVQLDSSPDSESPSNHGIYTPFVKSVTITIDNPAIKNLQIVDTPGLNDSNEINSAETTQWINQAHAVVYVLDVSGTHASDVDFFGPYFPAAAAEARIFVQNKIDMSPCDYMGARQAIQQYGKQPKYRELGLFGEKEVICSYSAMAALIQKKMAANIPLTENEEFYRENVIPVDFNGDPDELEKKLAERLFQRGGSVRLDKAKGLIRDVYQSAIERCETEIAVCERRLPDCDKTEEELNKDIDKFEKYRAKIENLKEKARQDFDDFIEDCKHAIDDSLYAAGELINKEIQKAAEECGATDEAAKARIPTELMKLKRRAFRKVRDVAMGKRSELRAKLIELRDEIDVAARSSGIMEKVVIPAIKLDAKGKIDEVLEELEVSGDDLYNALPGRIKKILTGQSTKDLVDKIMSMVTPPVEESVKLCEDSLENLFVETGDREFDSLLEGYRQYCKERDEELNVAKEKLSESMDRKKILHEKLSQLKKHLDEIRDSEREMKHLIDSPV